MSTTIKVLLADDQALVRGALAALLALEPDLEVVAEVGRGDEVVAAARASGADVCLLDIEMPGVDGIAAAAAVRSALPGVRTLVVTTFGRPGYLRRALEAGASGFVVKDTPARQLAEAVRRVHAGLRVVDPRHRMVLAWVLREATTNVVRHSDADACWVELESNRLTVRDDGRGLGERPEGNGIRGLRERVEAAGGRLAIETGPEGHGTVLEVTL